MAGALKTASKGETELGRTTAAVVVGQRPAVVGSRYLGKTALGSDHVNSDNGHPKPDQKDI